jgi:hypothetical protein
MHSPLPVGKRYVRLIYVVHYCQQDTWRRFPELACFLLVVGVSTFEREIRMSVTTQFGTGPSSVGVLDQPIVPKRDALASQAVEITAVTETARIHITWPIVMLALGAVLTVIWTVVLGWATVAVITLVT